MQVRSLQHYKETMQLVNRVNGLELSQVQVLLLASMLWDAYQLGYCNAETASRKV